MGTNRIAKRSITKSKRKATLKKYKKERDLGACFHTGCQNNGDETFHCRTCESKNKSFNVQTCFEHRASAVAKIKTHTLTKHPVNLLRATAAAVTGNLKGDV